MVEYLPAQTLIGQLGATDLAEEPTGAAQSTAAQGWSSCLGKGRDRAEMEACPTWPGPTAPEGSRFGAGRMGP